MSCARIIEIVICFCFLIPLVTYVSVFLGSRAYFNQRREYIQEVMDKAVTMNGEG